MRRVPHPHQNGCSSVFLQHLQANVRAGETRLAGFKGSSTKSASFSLAGTELASSGYTARAPWRHVSTDTWIYWHYCFTRSDTAVCEKGHVPGAPGVTAEFFLWCVAAKDNAGIGRETCARETKEPSVAVLPHVGAGPASGSSGRASSGRGNGGHLDVPACLEVRRNVASAAGVQLGR